MIRPDKDKIVAYIHKDLKQRMRAICERDDSWTQSRIMREGIKRMVSEIDQSPLKQISFPKQVHAEAPESVQRQWFRPEEYSSILTCRQSEVLLLVAEGKSSRQIALQLNISRQGVELHRKNIRRKFGLHSRLDLVKFALNFRTHMNGSCWHERFRPELPGSLE